MSDSLTGVRGIKDARELREKLKMYEFLNEIKIRF
jgi:hypothetical protein